MSCKESKKDNSEVVRSLLYTENFMLFYIFLIFSIYIIFTLADYQWKYVWQRKLLLITPCFILFCIAIFRFDVGYDYPAYYAMVTSSHQDELERLEPMSRLFIDMAICLDKPYLLFVFFGIPTYILAFWTCYKTGNFQLAFWTYIFLFLFSTFGAIRQAIAIAIIMSALVAMKNRRLYLYLALCFIASLFHYSALIMLPIYFIYHYISWKVILLGMIATTIFFPIIISFLLENNIYSYHLMEAEIEGGSFIRFFYWILYLILLGISYRQHTLKKTAPFFTALIPALFFPFLFGGHLGGRLSWYLYSIFLFLIPQIMSQCGKKLRMAFMLMLCAYFFALLYVSSKAGDKSPYTPYKTIFEVDLDHPIFK